jgi:hypothetical protein
MVGCPAGVKGTNAMMLGSGIQILEAALQKAARGGVTTPPFIPHMDIKVYGKKASKKPGVMTTFHTVSHKIVYNISNGNA